MNTYQTTSSVQTGAGGLRDYMVYVYQSMALALSITGIVAFIVYQTVISSPAIATFLFSSPFKIVVMFAPFVMVLFLSFKIGSLSFEKARGIFYTYSALMGLSLSTIFLAYTGTSIARAFFVTAGTFAGMSLYGYTTKKDLTAFGSFLVMALIGLMIASIVNIFLKSSGMGFVISVLSVLIFTGLTAYDVQRIKETYYHYQSGHISDDGIRKVALMGALALYLDFINIFVHLLHLFGEERK
jgi:FtsH-binding integral membrane protein